jgi:hypothetical protein
MRKKYSRIAAAALAVALALPMGPLAEHAALAQTADANAPAAAATPVQVPQPDAGVNWPGAGYGAAALFGNVLYIPAKLVYAILGGFVGGATWLLTAGNTQTADTVWRSALGGDYVLTPQMVAGEQPINFSGPTQTPPVTANVPPMGPEPAPSASVGGVAPIAPLSSPPPAPAASSGSGPQPIDRGAGPAGSSGGSGAGLPNTSVE